MTRYNLYKKVTFDSAHKLKLDYESKCNELHGHTYIIEVWMEAEELNRNGIVCDFTHIKDVIMKLDHKQLNDIIPNPTAENIAKLIKEELFRILLSENANITTVKVRVWETPTGYVEVIE